jgi:hypothetical protein
VGSQADWIGQNYGTQSSSFDMLTLLLNIRPSGGRRAARADDSDVALRSLRCAAAAAITAVTKPAPCYNALSSCCSRPPAAHSD